jgi:hypothetical protein
MTDQNHGEDREAAAPKSPLRVRLPGFIREEEIGLGDALLRMAYAAGLRPCGGCERHAALLNSRIVFSK